MISQLGMIVELVGAAYLVGCAYYSKHEIAGLTNSYGGLEQIIPIVKKNISEQFKTQAIGFILLSLGLILQLLDPILDPLIKSFF